MSDSRKGVTRNRRRVDPDLSNAVADTIARWLAHYAENQADVRVHLESALPPYADIERRAGAFIRVAMAGLAHDLSQHRISACRFPVP